MRHNAARALGPSTDIQVVCFKLGTDDYAIDVMRIKEVVNYQKVIPLPKMPPFIEGVINLRGVVIPVVDLRKRFNLPAGVTSATKVIIVRVEKRVIGLVVDDATNIINLPKASLLAPSKILRQGEAEYLDGMVSVGKDGLLLILNLDKILTTEEKGSLDLPLQQ